MTEKNTDSETNNWNGITNTKLGKYAICGGIGLVWGEATFEGSGLMFALANNSNFPYSTFREQIIGVVASGIVGAGGFGSFVYSQINKGDHNNSE